MTVGVFAPGSVSLRLYPHDLPATGIVAELLAQARLAAEVGFDGVMTSEHHGGFAGYLPNPLQVAGWCLDVMGGGWAAACPLLLPLRPVALVAEEVAWLAARHPGRVGVGVAPGALPLDFELLEADLDGRVARFARDLPRLTAMLRGEALGAAGGDRALAACAGAPVPLLATAMSPGAVRRAAAAGAGLLYDGATVPERLAVLSAAHRAAGGTGARVAIRRAWLGAPPVELFDAQLEVYRSYSPPAALAHWKAHGFACADDPGELARELLAAVHEGGATALNLRIHVPGITPDAARAQIELLGREVLPLVRLGLADPDAQV